MIIMRDSTFSVELSRVKLLLTVQGNRFRLSGVPNYPNLPAYIKALHRHRDYEIFFMPNAALTVHTAEEDHAFSDSLVILPPTLSHHVSYEAQNNGCYLYFSMEAPSDKSFGHFEKLIERLSEGIVALPLSDDERFYLKKLNDAWNVPHLSETLPHLFALLFGEILARLIPLDRIESTAPTAKYGKHLNTIDAFLAMYYTEPVQLSDLANELYLCPKQASRIVRKVCGCSFSELINRHRLEASCMLLRYTDLDIKEIAAQVGYEYNNYFYTVFRKTYGMTPTQYRKRYQSAD